MSEIQFWLVFLVFNFIFFLPHYLLTYKESLFFPFFQVKKQSSLSKKMFARYFFIRSNQDIFKFNSDLILLSLLLVFLGKFISPKIIFTLVFVISLFGLINQIYIAVILHVFKSVPSIKSDLSFLDVGFLVASRSKWYHFVLIILVTILLLGLVITGSSFLINTIKNINTISISTLVLFSLLIPGFLKLQNYDYERLHHRAVFSPINHFYRNLKHTKEVGKFATLPKEFYQSKNQYEEIQLEKKPNIIIFALESYGSVLQRNDHFNDAFIPFIKEIETKLSKNQWKATSVFSIPPIYSGRSWLSYTTFLYGFLLNRVDLFNILFHKKSNFKYYRSLLSFFKKNGYQNYFFSGLGGYENAKVDFEQLSTVYTTDRFIKYEDYNYTGKSLSFASFGLTLPDQYTINYGYHRLLAKVNQPFAIFFPTLNSHWQWDSPLHIESDWSAYNDPAYDFATTMDESRSQEDRYYLSIKYQLNMVADFIQNSLNENDIIILFGDHQPPFVANEKDGTETPIHIISKNDAFLNSFSKFDFNSGLFINQNEKSIKMEGFYSLFMQVFVEHFGYSPQELPTYLPDGILLEE